MPMIDVQLRRFSVVSVRPFEEVVARLTSTIGRPDMNTFHSAIGAARTPADLEAVVEAVIGSSDLMEFGRFDAGEVMRTSPYVKAWHRDYAALGLVVVGLHAPEFEFGKRADNIDRGICDHGLTYPIALDNAFATWRALGNDAWPAKYLYDAEGRLVQSWAGEGRYDAIEAEIRRQLVAAQPGRQLPSATREATAFARTGQASYAGITNETYVGSDRREPGTIKLEGDWRSGHQYVELRKGTGKIILPFIAGEVNLVMEPGRSVNTAVTVLLDGKPVGEARGADVGTDSVARVNRSGMFRLVAHASRGRHVLTLVATEPGLRSFVFTFGP
jgi:hypothetical protein